MRENVGVKLSAVSRMRPGWRSLLGVAFAMVAVSVLLIRLPGAFRTFDQEAAFNATRDGGGGFGASADSLDIDNEFVANAMNLVPVNASYAVLQPASAASALKNYAIAPLTLQALSPYMLTVLLPRRQVAPSEAQWILCYACNRLTPGLNVDWRWQSGADLIGRVLR